jgi:hypothetical protein
LDKIQLFFIRGLEMNNNHKLPAKPILPNARRTRFFALVYKRYAIVTKKPKCGPIFIISFCV